MIIYNVTPFDIYYTNKQNDNSLQRYLEDSLVIIRIPWIDYWTRFELREDISVYLKDKVPDRKV